MIKKILSLIEKRQRSQFYWLIVLVACTGLSEILGIGSILPFLNIISVDDPENFDTLTKFIYDLVGFSDLTKFSTLIGIFVIIFLTTSNIMRSLSLWAVARFVWRNQAEMAYKLLDIVLNKPFEDLAEEHSADASRDILAETQLFVTGVLQPIILMVTHGLIVLSISLVLFIYDPLIAIYIFTFFSIFFGGFLYFVSDPLKAAGTKRLMSAHSRFKVVDEGLNLIKILKTSEIENKFARRIIAPSRILASAMAFQTVVRTFPRYLFEVIAFGSVVIIVIVLINTQEQIGEIITTVGLLTFAAYRMLPPLSAFYQGVTSLDFFKPLVNRLVDLRFQEVRKEPKLIQGVTKGSVENPKNKILISSIDLCYKYPTSKKKVLDNISFEIDQGQVVAIVGKTGSGKSTLIDIILGLLQPNSGSILFKGQEYNRETLSILRKSIGYVPQDVVLIDETIASNVSLEFDSDKIDHQRVIEVLKLTEMDAYIDNLPDKYNSFVGEKGAKLSGGQIQRLGIARALYRNPEILILDEGTSNLDQTTEANIYSKLLTSGLKTVIVVAHRLNTITNSDKILLVNNGKIEAKGTFEELSTKSSIFKEMVDA